MQEYVSDVAKSACHKHDCFEWCQLIFSIMTFIAVSVYTLITGLQLKVSGDAEQRQLRAYLSPKVSIKSLGVNKTTRIDADIKNVGQTPAYDVRTTINFAYWPDLPPAQEMDPHIAPYKSAETRSIINAQADPLTIELVSPWFFSEVQFKDYALGGMTGKVFVWGRVDYTDAFGCIRFVRYCQVYDGVTNQGLGRECQGTRPDRSDDPYKCNRGN